jgi:hypothetical protein
MAITTSLPSPTGQHAVGRVALDLVDDGREDPFARRRGTPRRLAVWVWYPAVREAPRRADVTRGVWGLAIATGVAFHAVTGPSSGAVPMRQRARGFVPRAG